jgi:hypothetical protein
VEQGEQEHQPVPPLASPQSTPSAARRPGLLLTRPALHLKSSNSRILSDQRPQSRQSSKQISRRRNWDSPNPSPAGECAPPPRFRGEGTLVRGRGSGGSPNSDEGTYAVVLYLYLYFLSKTIAKC